MKYRIPALILTAAVLSACSTGRPSIAAGGAQQLSQIRHICIIANPKNTHPEWHQNIARSLARHNISSEVVHLETDRRRLYDDECRYNLRFSTRGNADTLNYASVLIRTPERPVVSIRDNFTNRNGRPLQLQAQTDSLIDRLLGK